jgi:hypothetical protein
MTKSNVVRHDNIDPYNINPYNINPYNINPYNIDPYNINPSDVRFISTIITHEQQMLHWITWTNKFKLSSIRLLVSQEAFWISGDAVLDSVTGRIRMHVAYSPGTFVFGVISVVQFKFCYLLV